MIRSWHYWLFTVAGILSLFVGGWEFYSLIAIDQEGLKMAETVIKATIMLVVAGIILWELENWLVIITVVPVVLATMVLVMDAAFNSSLSEMAIALIVLLYFLAKLFRWNGVFFTKDTTWFGAGIRAKLDHEEAQAERESDSRTVYEASSGVHR